jgi:nitroreductase
LTDNIIAIGEKISNTTLDNIYQRRPVRNFSDKEISDEKIKEIMRARTYALTALFIKKSKRNESMKSIPYPYP